MKTDRFSDIIRRKLESIRPEFSEKDWTRMQSSLQTGIPQPGTTPSGSPFSGGLWTAKPWLMAAATVSAVVLVGYGFWQHNEINRLRQTIGQLSKQPTQQTAAKQPTRSIPDADETALSPSTENQSHTGEEELLTSSDIKTVDRNKRDTVYITRYVSVPSRSHVVPPEDDRFIDRSEKPTDQRYATTDHTLGSTAQPNQSDNLPNNPKTNAYGEPSTSSSIVSKSTGNSLETVTKSSGKRPRERRLSNQYGTNRPTNEKVVSTEGRLSQKNQVTNSATIQDNALVPTPTAPTAVDQAKPLTAANYELIAIPSVSTSTINWTSQLAQRAKRIRPARTTIVSGAVEQAPESQPINHVAGRFRAGVGGELASKVVSAGVFTEVLLGPKKNWSVGIGLSQATYNGKFVDDFDFDLHMKRDFRKEFAHNIDPRRQILDIDTRTTRIQIPVNLGYRISLNRNLVLSPNIGTSLNLTNNESGSYYCLVPIPQRGGYFDIFKFNTSQSIELITHVALGAGLEWQNRHWALQGSPVLTLPLQAEQLPTKTGPSWQANVTLGLRARVLYQF